jgi:hypothetical protein
MHSLQLLVQRKLLDEANNEGETSAGARAMVVTRRLQDVMEVVNEQYQVGSTAEYCLCAALQACNPSMTNGLLGTYNDITTNPRCLAHVSQLAAGVA